MGLGFGAGLGRSDCRSLSLPAPETAADHGLPVPRHDPEALQELAARQSGERAYARLPQQTDAAETDLRAVPQTGDETTVKLESTLPVRLVSFTAYPGAKGRLGYCRDIHGRDATLFEALTPAGVELAGVQG